MKTKERLTKILSWWLIISMLMQMLPISVVSVFAQDNTDPDVQAESADNLDALVEDSVQGSPEKGYTVEFLYTDEDGKTATFRESELYYPNKPLELPELEDGYSWAEGTPADGTPVTDNMTLYVVKTKTETTDNSDAVFRKTGTRGVDDDYWTVTFYDRDAKVVKAVEVTKGETIGDQLPAAIARDDYDAFWAIGEIQQGAQGPEPHVTGARINSTFMPEEDTTVVPYYEKITYTVTFYEEDQITPVATKTVDADTSYYINDMPTVPAKSGNHGKWVYSGGDFSNQVAVNTVADKDERTLDVWAEYELYIFTVTFKVGTSTYETDTYYSGDTLTLPADPVVEGKEFLGWFIGETEYVGGESVTSNLTIEAKFKDEFSVTFVVQNEDGETIEQLSRYFRTEGEAIGQMPQDPFVAGKVFENWLDENGNEVTADTVVSGNMTVIAQFRKLEVYKITAEYYYEYGDEQRPTEEVFNTDLHEAEEHELPYTITAPLTTQTDSAHVAGGPLYYAEVQSIEVTEDKFDANKECTIRFKYVPYTAEYDFVYKLKDLTGNGYTEIPDSREHVYGVLNSYVTPTVKNFDYAVLEIAQGADITEASGQVLEVKYTRKNYQLTYETNGGSYVGGSTHPYGSTVKPSSNAPTRAGYTFDGWFTDAALTQQVPNTGVQILGDTTLYAKWNGANVNYTIVYMFEKYNDAGTDSSYEYDNSRDATGTVGTTVQASSAPTITRKGWEVDTAKNATSSVVIAPDGSSVLYVYYKLTEYTFLFRPGVYYYNNYIERLKLVAC